MWDAANRPLIVLAPQLRPSIVEAPKKPNVPGMKCLWTGRQHPHGLPSSRGGWSCSLGTQVMLVCRPARRGPHCTPLLVTRRPGGEHVCSREAPGKRHAPPLLFRRTPRAFPLVCVHIRVTKARKKTAERQTRCVRPATHFPRAYYMQPLGSRPASCSVCLFTGRNTSYI